MLCLIRLGLIGPLMRAGGELSSHGGPKVFFNFSSHRLIGNSCDGQGIGRSSQLVDFRGR